MADFCKQCLMRHFGGDTGDLRMPEKGLYQSLCEGCGGYIIHDENGERQTEYPILNPEDLP